MYSYDNYKQSADYIMSKTNNIPKTAIVLGSGLGVMIDGLDNTIEIPYRDIPFFPVPTAPSHAGKMVITEKFIALSGRFHHYEGYDMEECAYYVRVLKLLGVKNLILTNAAGGINLSYNPGELMLITDHINFSGKNPLIGPNDNSFGVRFPDMTTAYTPELRELAKQCAHDINTDLKEGVYAYMTGPNYETPAEIKALRTLGADAVGMSTVPEAIAARHAGINILAISCITNMAAGVTGKALTEEEVIEVADKTKKRFSRLIFEIMNRI